MRDTLIVLNYQREIPPFMQTVLHYADKQFKRIFYITPQLYNDNRESCRCENLQVFQIPRKERCLSYMKLPAFLLRKDTIRQIGTAVKHKKMNLQYVKNMVVYGVCSDLLYRKAKECMDAESIKPENCLVLAAWFHVEAFAAGKLKKRYPALRVVSYAHGFEINEEANPFALFSMNETKHRGCDAIGFIAKTTRQRYLEKLAAVYPQVDTDNITTTYLGSEKRFENVLAQPSDDRLLRIVSCSGVVSGKRLNLIVDALENCSIQIHWTHIGGGPLLEQIQTLARQKLARKENVTYDFTGTVTNEQVQSHYATQPVDLFVNVSESEGLPVSIMECLSYGVPVVATDVGGTAEIVTEETGFLLEKDFPAGKLTDILENYWALDNEKQKRYRDNAYAFWKRELDASRNAVAFLSRQTER